MPVTCTYTVTDINTYASHCTTCIRPSVHINVHDIYKYIYIVSVYPRRDSPSFMRRAFVTIISIDKCIGSSFLERRQRRDRSCFLQREYTVFTVPESTHNVYTAKMLEHRRLGPCSVNTICWWKHDKKKPSANTNVHRLKPWLPHRGTQRRDGLNRSRVQSEIKFLPSVFKRSSLKKYPSPRDKICFCSSLADLEGSTSKKKNLAVNKK